MSTQPTPTRRTDRRTAREELQSEAPLCPDLGTNDAEKATDLRRELRQMREQLDRIERRLEAER